MLLRKILSKEIVNNTINPFFPSSLSPFIYTNSIVLYFYLPLLFLFLSFIKFLLLFFYYFNHCFLTSFICFDCNLFFRVLPLYTSLLHLNVLNYKTLLTFNLKANKLILDHLCNRFISSNINNIFEIMFFIFFYFICNWFCLFFRFYILCLVS